MTSPLLTVVVLTVLWLVVVVPMIVRRNDERAKDRAVDGFGQRMRALGRRSAVADRHVADAEVFVAGESTFAPAVRRPIPGAREAVMYDRSDLHGEISAARARMMARRRRSLTTLGVGSAVTLIFALVLGGAAWVLTALFVAGLGGYLLFLRGQARRDRDRRQTRQQRAAARRPRDHDLSDLAPAVADNEAIVRIDDDDLALHNLDTVDLTGLYHEQDAFAESRRAG